MQQKQCEGMHACPHQTLGTSHEPAQVGTWLALQSGRGSKVGIPSVPGGPWGYPPPPALSQSCSWADTPCQGDRKTPAWPWPCSPVQCSDQSVKRNCLQHLNGCCSNKRSTLVLHVIQPSPNAFALLAAWCTSSLDYETDFLLSGSLSCMCIFFNEWVY